MGMTLKIICNPYTKKIDYKYKSGDKWENLYSGNPLLKFDGKEFSYIATDVVRTTYELGYEKVIFEGSPDDYEELEYAVKSVLKLDKKFEKKELIICERSDKQFQKASYVLESIENNFKGLLEIINTASCDQEQEIKSELNKFNETIVDEIPLVIMGTYSCGKSAFINALIGLEVLPSAIGTTTAQIHRIRKSPSSKKGKISFIYDSDKVEINFYESDIKVETVSESEFCKDLYSLITENSKDNTIESHIYSALKQINKHYMAKKSALIEIEVPSKSNKGIFSHPKLNFSVIDTPGSDSASNLIGKSHFDILRKTIKDQTNGLPILVTKFDNMNSASNREILEEMKNVNLDRSNMFIIVNQAELIPVEEFDSLVNEKDVIRDWQSTRIYFTSSIAGLAGQKKGEISFYNHYGQGYKDCRNKFINRNDPAYRELYAFNIMPESQKHRITISCQNNIESGDEKAMLFANSGIQCVVEEIFTYGEKHSLYNKCAKAREYLGNAINILELKINENNKILEKDDKDLEENLNEKQKSLIKDIESKSEDFLKDKIEQYPNMLSTTKDEKLENAKTKINNEWINNYEELFKSQMKDKGVDSLSILKRVGEKFSCFTIENNNDKYVVGKSVDNNENGDSKSIANRVREGINKVKEVAKATGKTIYQVAKEIETAKKEHDDVKKVIREEVVNKVAESLLNDIRDIDNYLYTESVMYFKPKEQEFKEKLISIIMEKRIDEISEEDKKKITNEIEKYPNPKDLDESNIIFKDYKVNQYLFLKKIDLGGINYKNLAEEAKKKLDEMVANQALDIIKDISTKFNSWAKDLIKTVEEEITSLNPDLADKSKLRVQISQKLSVLRSIYDKVKSSSDAIKRCLYKEEENE